MPVKNVTRVIPREDGKAWIALISMDGDIEALDGTLIMLSRIAGDVINTLAPTLPSSIGGLSINWVRQDTTGLCDDTTKSKNTPNQI